MAHTGRWSLNALDRVAGGTARSQETRRLYRVASDGREHTAQRWIRFPGEI